MRRSLNEECLALYQEAGDKEGIAWSLYWLADTISAQGEYSRGNDLFEESLTLFRELGYKRGIAWWLTRSAMWLFSAEQGDQSNVLTRLEESLTLFKELGEKNGMASSLKTLGWVALIRGDIGTAQGLVEQCLGLYQEIGFRLPTIEAIALLGQIRAHKGDFVAARAYHMESLASAKALNFYYLCTYGLEGLADIMAIQGEVAWAARLWGAAESLHERIGNHLQPVERADYELAVAAARTRLGEQAFAIAWAEGRTMTIEQVLAELK